MPAARIGAEAESKGAEESEQTSRARATAMLCAVRDRLLPELYSHLKDPKTEAVRVPGERHSVAVPHFTPRPGRRPDRYPLHAPAPCALPPLPRSLLR